MPEFKPSQIDPFARSHLPFVATFKRAESEIFAAMMVLTLVQNGDEWKSLEPKSVGFWLRDLPENELAKWNVLCICRPHPHDLVADGFAKFTNGDNKHGPIEFTELGFEKLAKWVKP